MTDVELIVYFYLLPRTSQETKSPIVLHGYVAVLKRTDFSRGLLSASVLLGKLLNDIFMDIEVSIADAE